MTGLGFSMLDVAARRTGTFVPPAAVTSVVIEGDSQTSTSPDQSANRGDFYSYAYADDSANAGVTFHVRAQASRTVGGAAYAGPPPESADPGPNTLLDHRSEDLAYGPQLITAMLGSNDLGTFSVDAMMARWLSYAPPVRSAGIKLAIVAPPPYHPSNSVYATFNPRWVDYVGRLRNPAVRAAIADYYIPLGEHPDLRDPALVDAMFNTSDKLHMTGPVSNPATGQARAFAVFRAAIDTIRDASRTSATSMYAAAWPTSETDLTPGATIVRRVMVKGIAHAGLTSGASVSGPIGTTIALNGGPAGASVGTGGGTGYAIYNGDVLDVTIPLSGSNATAVSIDLTIGGETRTLTYTTGAAVTPAAYVHGDIVGQNPGASIATYSGCNFAAAGIGVLGVNAANAPTAVTVGGVAATSKFSQAGDFGGSNLSMWTVPIAATGTRTVVLTFAGYTARTVLSWGVVTDADPSVTILASSNTDGDDGDPQTTNSATVPASGLALGMIAIDTGGAAPSVTGSSGSFVGSASSTLFNGETATLAVAKRATTGTLGWTNTGYGPHPRGGLIFRAAGT